MESMDHGMNIEQRAFFNLNVSMYECIKTEKASFDLQ